ELELPANLARRLGEVGRGADIGRHVAEVAGEVHAVGDGARLADGGTGGGLVGAIDGERDRARPAGPVVGLALEAVEAIGRIARGERGAPDLPGEVLSLDLDLVQQGDCVLAA